MFKCPSFESIEHVGTWLEAKYTFHILLVKRFGWPRVVSFLDLAIGYLIIQSILDDRSMRSVGNYNWWVLSAISAIAMIAKLVSPISKGFLDIV